MSKYILFTAAVLSAFMFGCAEDNAGLSADAATSTGTGGSLARFTIVNNFLYTIDNTTLTTFELSELGTPSAVSSMPVGQGVETIFPLNDYLLMGTQSGLLIYQIGQDGTPTYISQYNHVISCDPVVANTSYAYVTLRATGCREAVAGAADLLEVIDISTIENPTVVGSYDMEAPRGVGLDGDVLFVCEGTAGLKVFSTANPLDLQQIDHLTDIHAVDVIPLDGLLLVVGPDKIVQLDYTDINDIKVLSEILIGV